MHERIIIKHIYMKNSSSIQIVHSSVLLLVPISEFQFPADSTKYLVNSIMRNDSW
jgi:hypothetical protein